LAEKKDLLYFIENLISFDEYWKVNYYLRCLKKQPHGGVASIDRPNFYLHHFTFDSSNLFKNEPQEFPFFMNDLINEATELYAQCEVDFEELLQYCFRADYWYMGFRLLQPKPEFEELNQAYPLIWKVIEEKLSYQDYFTIDLKLAIYALICCLVQEKATNISGVEDIVVHEIFEKQHNKYGLTNIGSAQFLRQGFRLGDKFYLYSIFLDTSLGNPTDTMPYTIRLIKDETSPVEIFMRCDENLAVPFSERLCTATTDAEKFHGITVGFADIQSLVFQKEIVVHIHPETMHKILLTIKPDSENDGQGFFHIEVEELWNPALISDPIVATNYIHAKYYPEPGSFNHVDFSINQYSKEVFAAKFQEAVSETGIPVDRYADQHYKVWCIEGENVSINTWSSLVCATLDEPFREIFLETFRA
jgi:hypothetical protein